MYERGKRESAAAEALRGWTFVPIVDESSDTHSVGRGRLPARFGGWWRHHDLDDDGQLEAPSGKEIILRLRIVEGGAYRRGDVQGFEDEFERQGVPAMRDMTMQVFSVLDGRDLSGSLAGMMRAVPMDDREQALGGTVAGGDATPSTTSGSPSSIGAVAPGRSPRPRSSRRRPPTAG
ncbi:MAG: hypothetical protein WKF58_09585 [Ilumatobacteraceae bacterium]